ncbi:MAG: response regulator transcription factor [Campylobacterales bacterium]|nr:response regulator transcription factor [Campylobacterales bacterium]
MRVLLLEDEYTLRISVSEFLEDLGYTVDGYANGDAAFDAVFSQSYDILLLDVNVPGMNGFELLGALRKEGNRTPAIFITSMTQMQHLQEGYERGCCDYIRKPFDLGELQLRMMQVCKQVMRNDSDLLTLAPELIYDLKQFTLTYQGAQIALSRTEKEMLGMLLKYRNQVVTVGMFQDEIWGEYVDPANVRVQINNLRKKLPDGVIQNRRGLGYILER